MLGVWKGRVQPVEVSEDEANEDEDMGEDKEPVEMHCKTQKEKERLKRNNCGLQMLEINEVLS
jgi:hypothetical protein